MNRKRAATVTEIIRTKFKEMPFTGQWEVLFGRPEMNGCWIIWGESANGKTAFALQLAKYLCNFSRVAYDSIEEGISMSLKRAVEREGMIDVQRRFLILHKETIEDIEKRLAKRKAPGIIFIDSVQYTGLNKITAKELIDRHPHKLFIFTSHSQSKLPDGRTANAIRYHADVKIRVEGFRAWIESRYGGKKNEYYTIYPEGAREYWGDEVINN